ncbi:MAG: DHHA1 domain-containing protein, partial [Crocinitomicaceae bacterium]
FEAVVDEKRRRLTASNHTSTHLLHHALRQVLGTHVEQKGSLVGPDYLRFDFSHFAKITDEEMVQIESLVRTAIQENTALNERRAIPIADAKELGAMALFGEKYGDLVRVIQYGDSVELCGGTHVPSTGTIGLFKIKSESSVAAGIRRIEAISNEAVEAYYHEKEAKLSTVEALLKHPANLEKAVEELIAKNQQLTKSIEQFEREQAKAIKNELKSALTDWNGVPFIGQKVSLGAGLIKDILFQLKAELKQPFVAVIGGEEDGKATLSIMISEELVNSKSWHAGNLVRDYAKLIQGGGGGQPFFATAGGKDPKGLDKAIEAVKNALV